MVNWKKVLIAIIVIGVGVMLYISQGLRRSYEAEVQQSLTAGAGSISGLLTEQDIAALPAPVQKYLRYVGAVGKPKVWNVRASFTGRMKQDPNKDWMNITAEQYNFYPSPTRMFYIKAKMFGVPIYGLHAYKDEQGTMLIKAAGIVPVVNAKGREASTADTVTLFNDMCILAPATLIDKRIAWEAIDDLTVKASFTNGANKISAQLLFNPKGELVNFVSDDRYMTVAGGKYRKLRWSTPLRGEYKDFHGIKLASQGDAIWNMPEGDYTYAEFNFQDVEYNCTEFK